MSVTLPNVIFLDMDGVLCTPRACLATGNTGGGYSYLDPIACALVALLCKNHHARLVISSAWRQSYNERELMEAILNAAYPNLGSLIWPSHQWWRTPSAAVGEDWRETSDRGREIRSWIAQHETEFNNFCILDDMDDMRPYQDSLVKCHPYDGIGFFQYELASQLLAAPASASQLDAQALEWSRP